MGWMVAAKAAQVTGTTSEPKTHAASPDAVQHWAVRPLVRAELPSTGGVGNPVDRFIGHRLSAAGLSPAKPAPSRTWLRRVALDLTGLPPTAEELDRFEREDGDDAPGVRERWVEAYLASPAYGERWGRWWLDVARYADTNGQDENKVMANAWRYRDWVVRAFNADMPFDRFVLEQVAGDLLPGEGLGERERFDRWMATGFLVLGPKLLAEQDKPKLVMDIIDEQIDTVGRAFLGLTLGCARCHDHKFDPVSQREYYALAGIFRGTRTMENLAFVSKFNERPVATREDLAEIQRHAADLAAAESAVTSVIRDADAALESAWARGFAAAWRGDAVGLPPPWVERVERFRATNTLPARLRADLDAEGVRALERWRARREESGSGLVPGVRGGAFEARGTNRVEFTSIRSGGVPGWTVAAWVRRGKDPSKGEPRRWLVSRGANEWEDGHLALVLDGDRAGAYANLGGGREHVHAAWSAAGAVRPDRWVHLAAVFEAGMLRVFVNGTPAGDAALPSVPQANASPWVVGMRPDGHVGLRGRIDEVRVVGGALSAADIGTLSGGEVVGDVVVREDFDPREATDQIAMEERGVAELLWGEGGLLTVGWDAERRSGYSSGTRLALARLEDHRDRLKALAPPPPAVALAVVDAPATNVPVMSRGNHLQPVGDPVPRGFPRWLGEVPVQAPGESSGRLELAQWLVHPSNPLTARVLVNRVWTAHFGQGLVRSPENFGTTGEEPTHPELLDWLAARCVEDGWSVKVLHRWIVLSDTYAQSSEVDPHRQAVDPENRLLHRYPRQRLDAESLRDAILAVSGQLDRRVGGSLVDWKNDEYVPGDDAPFQVPRRTLYLPVVRDRGTDLCTAFDGANPSVPVPQRSTTVVAPQALYLLNAPMVVSAARAVAGRAADVAGEFENLYRVVLGRSPRPAERERVRRWMRDARLESLAETERRVVLAQALLASNEFTHRE